MTTRELPTQEFLQQAEQEAGRYDWEGTFADYLAMVSANPSMNRLSHKLVHDSILSKGVETAPDTGKPNYKLFEGEVFGLNDTIESIVEYFASSARRLEVRKRILLLLGPPATGKSTIVGLIKRSLEGFTRTNEGAAYCIKNCPMQEEPLHLLPHNMRRRLFDDYGIYVEGDLCPRCRYALRTEYGGKISDVLVTRTTFSEQEAIGIGYYVATSNPTDATLLVGSVDTSRLEGDRLSVAGKAFRLDGELNVANRGLMEFVELFKTDSHLLTTLLGLAQEQLIKMDRFGSVYADEVIIGHSNEGDFKTFLTDPSSEALRDRIVRIYVPYNLRVSDELRIYNKLLESGGLDSAHLSPLTLPAVSTFAILSRLDPPGKPAVTVLDKLHAYDGMEVTGFTQDEAAEERRLHPGEGMKGISPRAVMNRLSARAAAPDVECMSPLNALDSIWQGRNENVSLTDEESEKYLGFVQEAISDYNERAIKDVQKAFEEGFEETAESLMTSYLAEVAASVSGASGKRISRDGENNMRAMERPLGISDRAKNAFRVEIHHFFEDLRSRGTPFNYSTEPRLRAAIEKRLLPERKALRSQLEQARSPGRLAEWQRKRAATRNRLINTYGYCRICAEDLVEYVIFLLRGNTPSRITKNSIEWNWNLNPGVREQAPGL